jgi:hypothetical protein
MFKLCSSSSSSSIIVMLTCFKSEIVCLILCKCLVASGWVSKRRKLWENVIFVGGLSHGFCGYIGQGVRLGNDHHLFLSTALLPMTDWLTDWLHGFSPQANYTDRATAACRRS